MKDSYKVHDTQIARQRTAGTVGECDWRIVQQAQSCLLNLTFAGPHQSSKGMLSAEMSCTWARPGTGSNPETISCMMYLCVFTYTSICVSALCSMCLFCLCPQTSPIQVQKKTRLEVFSCHCSHQCLPWSPPKASHSDCNSVPSSMTHSLVVPHGV